AFTQLALTLRAKTGRPLEFALSFTATRKNIEFVPDVIRWYLANPERTRIWRMLSFQPEADTGRTIFSERPITPDDVWKKICEGTGLQLRRDATIFGHPDCNSWASLLVARPSGRYAALLPDDPRWDALMGRVLARIGGLSLVTDDAGTPPWRLAGVLAQNPLLALRVAAYFGAHLLSRKLPHEILRGLIRGQVHTFSIGIHNFMDAAKTATAATDPVVKSRLESCVFKGAVKQNGEWIAVPMCKRNQETWSRVYDQRLRVPIAAAAPSVAQIDAPQQVGAEA